MEKIFQIIKTNNITDLKSMLLDRGDTDYVIDGLAYACSRGREEMVEIIIENIKQSEQSEKTRMMKIGDYIYTNTVLDIHNIHGETPLTCAARANQLKICEILLQEGACINQTTQYVHQTPLHVAVEHGNTEIVEYLIQQGADVQIPDNVNISPLYTAIKGGNSAIVHMLIDAGCDVNLGSQDHAPVFLTARLGLLPITQALCEAGCNKDFANKYGVTPLAEAVQKDHLDIVEYLVGQHCDVNNTDVNGTSALHIACRMGNLEAVTILMNGRANPILKNSNGQTAFQLAIENNKYEVVEYLMNLGADILSQPFANKSLSSISKVFDRGHIQTAEVLLRGCPKLPLPHYPGVTDMFCNNGHLMKMLFLSGIQTIPGVLIVPRLHPQHVNHKEISDWLKNFHKNPLSLQSLCRIRVRRCLGNTLLLKVKSLPIPPYLKDFVALKHL
ncbi:ankyrin-2-like [Saccostrea cucullata]|uniref:ankyrin-2-like n=1 Tax=Saccostrea cuccullata TaxID=36930 RepID=UPI002ED4EDE9